MLKNKKELLRYLLTFLGVFALLFYGTEAVIGFSAPGNHYIGWVDAYLNFIPSLRQSLLVGSKALLSVTGLNAEVRDSFTLGLVGGKSVRIVYSCIGYGVLSFWVSFIAANRGTSKGKAVWILCGCLLLHTLNTVRISLVLVAVNKGWPMPLGWDHHTWFNVVCYLLIFAMIHAYDKRRKEGQIAPGKKIPGLPNGGQFTFTSQHVRKEQRKPII